MTPPFTLVLYTISFYIEIICFICFLCIMKVFAAEFTAWISESKWTKRVLFSPWSHQVGIHSMLLHIKLHLCQSSPCFHLHWGWCHRITPCQWFASSNSDNCSQNLGTAFLLCFVSLCTYPCKQQLRKEGQCSALMQRKLLSSASNDGLIQTIIFSSKL